MEMHAMPVGPHIQRPTLKLRTVLKDVRSGHRKYGATHGRSRP